MKPLQLILFLAMVCLCYGLAGFGPAAPKATAGKAPSLAAQEAVIQANINGFPFLRESMELSDEMKLHIQQKGDINVDAKEQRLAHLREVQGWNDSAIRNKLHEITWDAFAESRNTRHE